MNAPQKIEAATLASAMAAAFAEIEGATKSANNPHFKSKYADLTAVIDAIKPALINHNLFFTQHPEPNDKGVCVETVLHHAGGEHFSLGKLFVPANKNDAQGFGSALTYARRYALVTAFGVPVEDDDGNAASKAVSGSGKGQIGGATGEPTGPADTITVADLTLAIQLCDTLGGNQAQTICEAYRVSALTELTAKQGAAVVTRLKEKLEAKLEKENA